MKMNRIFRFAAAVSAAVLLSACASAPAAPEDERFVLISPEDSFQLLYPQSETATVNVNLLPGKIYAGETYKGHLRKFSSEVQEDGHLAVRVIGQTAPYSGWYWLWHGEKERVVAFRFLWFDKDGKLLKSDLNRVPAIRRCLPGDPIRFSAIATDEKATQFSMIIHLLDDNQIKWILEGQEKKGDVMDETNPVKKDPLKEVKITK